MHTLYTHTHSILMPMHPVVDLTRVVLSLQMQVMQLVDVADVHFLFIQLCLVEVLERGAGNGEREGERDGWMERARQRKKRVVEREKTRYACVLCFPSTPVVSLSLSLCVSLCLSVCLSLFL